MFQFFDGLQVSASGALRGLKDTRVSMLITLVSYWLIGIGSGLWFCFVANWAGRGLWFGLVLGLATASPLLAWRFHRLTSQAKASLQQAAEAADAS
jgi:MATE family multidrug resistance protein